MCLPSGASEGSLRVGLVTRIDGSLMSCRLSMSSSKTPAHDRPKWMLWCAVFVYACVEPASSRKHEGE
jgi:hypothetical protein